MYTKRTFQKYSALLSLLATLYLVLGSQAIHPLFHAQTQNTEHSHQQSLFADEHHSEHEHSSVSLSTDKLLTEHCPVCAILACCWFAPFPANSIAFQIDSTQLATIKYSASGGFLQPSVYRIRGPPVANC